LRRHRSRTLNARRTGAPRATTAVAHRRRRRDRVDAEVGPRAVRGAADRLDLPPREALVRDDELQRGRLGHDARVGAEALEHRLDADAGVLLVSHRGDDHVAGEVRAGRGRAREHAGRDAALHVVAAAAVEAAVAHLRRMRVAHPIDADRVDVAAEHQRAPAAAAARDADDRRPPARGVDDLDVEPRFGEPARDVRRDLALPRPAGHERRVHRVDRHQVGDELIGVIDSQHLPHTLPSMTTEITKTDAQWREELTPEQYEVLRKAGTERAFTGRYWDSHDDGVYRCAGCGAELFDSQTKFESGSGWPSFTEPKLAEAVELRSDDSLGMRRTEVVCKRCGGHLGHVFDDGPQEAGGLRYCINSCSLDLARR
jgi:peptide-methionine (R)-S-oxide reductase